MAFLNIPQEYASKSTDQIVAEAGTGGLPLIPAGKYPAIIVKSEMKETSKGGQMLVLTAVITQGDFRDTEFVERANIINDNATAVKIGYETLAKIAKSVGLQSIPADSAALHNKPLVLTIKTEKGTPFKDKNTGEMREGKDKSVIGGYDAAPQVGGGAPFGAAAASTSAMPWASK